MIQKQTEASFGLSNQYDKEYKGEALIKLALVQMGNMIWKIEDESYEEQNLIFVQSVLVNSLQNSDGDT